MAPKGYSATQIRLHWIIAALIVAQLIFGEGIGSAFRELVKTGIATYPTATLAHIIGGALILALALWRIALKVRRGAPDLPEGQPPLTKLAAKATHGALYLLMIGAPVSGAVAWFGGGIESVAEAHELAKPLFIGLIVLHVAGALWHQFVLKDGLLLRMKRPQD